MGYNEEVSKEIVTLYKSGLNVSEIHRQTGISRPTIYKHIKKSKDEISVENAPEILREKIKTLKNKKSLSSDEVVALSSLITALAKLEGQNKREAVIKPNITLEYEATELKQKALDDGGLFNYQKDFLNDNSQFRIVLKSRQIGFSYVASLDALIGAISGRNQLFLSASEEQALILMRYFHFWAEKFGIVLKKDSEYEITLENNAMIKALAHNFRTVQGFTGDIWMDEFAWYPNPKKIWHAFVPSIGAVKGRLTILSTPFEERSLFHELYSDEAKFTMFSRHRVDIYRAIKDGLEFDLDTMKALFDADTWASAYECVFIDDESSLLSINLIKSCVDEKSSYFTPNSKNTIFAGYDIGRVADRSSLAGVVCDGEIYSLAVLDVLAKLSFDEQKSHLKAFMNTYPLAVLKMDKTGIGLNLTEDMQRLYKSRVGGVWFSAVRKEEMALNLKKLFEDKKIRIPNDPLLISDLHAIKRSAGAKSFKYDAKRNEYGHADRFWALALACSNFSVIRAKKGGGAVII